MKAADLFDVSGQVAVVTGAASGLGLAMAEVMAENGAAVTLIDVDDARLAEAAERLRAGGGEVEAVVLDVTDTEALHGAIGAAATAKGRLDAVFANAGISSGPGFFVPEGAIEAVHRDNWDRVLEVNLTSVFETVRAASLHMKAQKGGRIVVTSSIAGLGAETMVGYPYIATKAAISNLVRQAAHELAPYGISINAIAPGPFRTNIAGNRIDADEVMKRFAELVPMGRVAEPDEIKGLALLLASPAASYLTGTVIPIDGGTSA